MRTPPEPETCFAVAAPGLEGPVADELRELGLTDVRVVPGGAEFEGGLPAGMRACLWSRCASTVRLRLAAFPAGSRGQLAAGLGAIPWTELVPGSDEVGLQATARRSRIQHTGLLTDAVSRAAPRIPWRSGAGGVHLRLDRDQAEVSLDLAGDLLHKRGWRLEGGPAPLRETLASALLRLCGWTPEVPFVDPMCGSGTLPIEAALRATRTAPGLGRTFAFERLPRFEAGVWRALVEEAEAARLPRPPAPIAGSDVHRGAVASAGRNAARAGVAGAISFERCDVRALTPPAGPPGVLVTNPPYGARIGARAGDLPTLYRALGDAVRSGFGGWQVGVLTSDARLARETGLPLDAGTSLRNGGVPVRLYRAVV